MKRKIKMVVCSIACFEEDADRIDREMSGLQYGVYHFGTEVRNLTHLENREVWKMTPKEIMESN